MRYRATFFLAALLLPLAPRAHGQAGGARNFTFPDPYPPPHQDRAKTITTGEEMIPQQDGSYLLKGVKIQTFRDTGDTNATLTMQAPSCIFDRKDHNASSPGPLQIDSGDGNMHIEGEGFLWLAGQTNTALTISNKVHTIIKKRYLAGQTNADVFPTPVSHGATNNAPGTNQVINVYSDHFHYDRQTDLITYSDHVQSEDSEIILTCDVMTIQRTTNGAVETIVGDGHVVIVNKADGGRTTSDHAVYTTKPDKQEVVLTGNPRLLQARREGTGKVFIFDHLQNTLRIEGDAYLKLPRESLGQSGLLLGSPSAPTNAPASNPPPSGTNGLADKFVEIYSDSMLFQMPPTNGPVQKVIADRNVVIVDPETNGRGTGGHAVYTDSTGLLELFDNAMWQADQRIAKGGLLIFDRNNKDFTVRTNAYLKLPAASFRNGTATNANATNRFVAVLCDHYEYRDNVMTFHDQAHAALLDGETVKGMLDCMTLTASFNTNNQLQAIRAEGDVYGRLLPAPASDGSTVEKEIKCDVIDVTMRTNGLVEEIVANQKVLATQTQTFTNNPVPLRQTLNSDTMTTTFQPATNAVAKIIAERNVVITRAEMTATGEQAVYTAGDDMARLTGNPLVVMTNGTLRGSVITLDRRNNKLLASKSKIVINVGTNKFATQPTVKGSAKKPAKKAAT